MYRGSAEIRFPFNHIGSQNMKLIQDQLQDPYETRLMGNKIWKSDTRGLAPCSETYYSKGDTHLSWDDIISSSPARTDNKLASRAPTPAACTRSSS